MNFKEIFEMQKALDESIHKTHNVSFEETLDKKVLALLVEVGEFANEIKPFKYWKKDKSIDRDKVLEEFVDGIHFFVSIANYFEIDPVIKSVVKHQDQSKQLLDVYEGISKLNNTLNKETLITAFELYMGIAELAGLKDEEIKEHYVSKNKVNYERIANNY